VVAKPSDMTPAVDLTYGKGTGPFRYRRPVYATYTPTLRYSVAYSTDFGPISDPSLGSLASPK
jgi:hypothetical protein